MTPRHRHRAALGLAACALASTTLFACAEPKPTEQKPFEPQGQPLTDLKPPAAPMRPSFTDCPEGWRSELMNEEPRCVPAWSVARPDFESCPAGWQSATWGTIAEADVCVPQAPTECSSGERADMESGQCVVVGSACPSAGDFASPPPSATTVLYVRTGGSGSGTQAAPFGTLDAAVAAAPAGTTILVAAGEYVTTSEIDDELTIVGACPSDTRIVGTSAPVPLGEKDEQFEGALHVTGSGKLTLSNVTLSGPRIPLTVKAGGTAVVEDVIVDDFTPFGMWVQNEGSTLSVARSSFVGGQVAEGKGHAAALVAAFDGVATVVASSFSGNHGRAIFGKEGADISLEDVSVVDVAAGSDGELASISVGQGSTLQALRVRLSGFHGSGIGALEGGQAKLAWTLVEHGAAETYVNSAGINSRDDGKLSCDHCLFRDIAGIAVYHEGKAAGDSLKLDDVVAAEMKVGADANGTLVSIQKGGFSISRMALLDVPNHALYANEGDGALTDVLVTGEVVPEMAPHGLAIGHGSYALERVETVGRPILLEQARFSLDEVSVSGWGGVTEATGRLIGLQLIGDGTVHRVDVAHGYGVGLSLLGDDIVATDVVVQSIKPKLGDFQWATGVFNGRSARGERWVVRDVSGVGLWSLEHLELSDALFQKTQSDITGALAVGVFLMGAVDVSQVHVDETYGAGMYASRAKGTLSDITITGSRPTQVGARYGQGLYLDGSQIEAERVAISDVHEAGVLVESSDATLRDLSVADVHPTAYLDSQGAGLWAMGEGQVSLERARFQNVHVVGLGFSQGASLSATDLEVSHVVLGRSLLLDAFGAQVSDGVGDCLLLAEGSRGDVDRTLLSGCARSGILVYRGEAKLGSVELRDAPVGLVTQFAELPEYQPPSVCLSNVGIAHLDDPGYPVPAGPPVGQALSEGVEFGDLLREDP